VLPVTSPPIADGAVAVVQDRILAVGTFKQLARELGAAAHLVDHDGRALVPALVNAHCHLELSSLGHLGRAGAPDGFCAWIQQLIHQRQQVPSTQTQSAASETLTRLRRRGVGLIGDIGNSPLGAELAAVLPPIRPFREFLGFAPQGAERALATLAELPPATDVAAHAPYSTAENLLMALHHRTRGRVLPLHLAESPEEMEFFSCGTGPMRTLLQDRGAWDGSWRPPPEGNPFVWLDRLGLLDEKLLCVHVVQAQESDIRLLARRRARLCLCPGSNRALGVGVAPLPALLEAGLVPALGTDSLASNPRLCLWREMAILRGDHPGVDPAAVFAMATWAGARVLDCQADWGGLAPDRRAAFLAVPVPVAAGQGSEVFEYLTCADEAIEPHWIG